MFVRRFAITFLIGMLLLGMVGVQSTPVSAQADPWTCDITTSSAATPGASGSGTSTTIELVPFPENPGTLTVFAAASLTDAFAEIKTTLETDNPGLEIIENFAGSQSLVTQLTEGAPADVAAFASNSAMDDAIEAGVVTAEPQTFAQNRLTIVVPSDNPAGITTAADLANTGVKIVLAQEEVPVGKYSRQSICKMAADTDGFGDDFVGAVAANVVSLEDNVRSVLSKIALGEADAGIVYTSDVTDDVTAIAIPDEFDVVATYPIAPVASGNQELADAYISYVLSPEGQAILASYGFIPVD